MKCDKYIVYSSSEIKDLSSFVHNFDVSVVIPFYKKMKEFRRVLPINAPYFQRNGIEVIIAMDEDSETTELLNYISYYPLINWKIIVNHYKHEWRNPTKAINVGIKNSSKKYILVCSPESEFYTDAIYLMRRMLHYYPDHFVIGLVAFLSINDNVSEESFYNPYGSIMFEKVHALNIGCYDESLSLWGGDDDNIRARLEMSGVKKIVLSEVQLIHREHKRDLEKRANKHSSVPPWLIRNVKLPDREIVDIDNWGNDFDDIVFNWKEKKNDDLLKIYLERFKKHEFSSKIKYNYDKILLVQSYNEKDMINNFLDDVSSSFDAIILLDDGSTDGTYEIAKNRKLILKVKKNRLFFNDLENRNILLDIVSFYNTEWIVFLDVDERLDKRFLDFSFTKNLEINVVSFNLIHLWNSPVKYNAEYPFSNKGIQLKYRMFRNIGRTQILTDKKALHFSLVPYLSNLFKSRLLILHYGHINSAKRRMKYEMYVSEDKGKDQYSYLHLLKENQSLNNIKDIEL